jgi:hypothetical protein
VQRDRLDVRLVPTAPLVRRARCLGTPASVNSSDLDLVAFQRLWRAGDPGADRDANAEFTALDFVCVRQLFAQGCE